MMYTLVFKRGKKPKKDDRPYRADHDDGVEKPDGIIDDLNDKKPDTEKLKGKKRRDSVRFSAGSTGAERDKKRKQRRNNRMLKCHLVERS